MNVRFTGGPLDGHVREVAELMPELEAAAVAPDLLCTPEAQRMIEAGRVATYRLLPGVFPAIPEYEWSGDA